MQLIDRYILKLFLIYLAAGIAVFVTLYLTVDAMSFALRNADAGSAALFKYYGYHTPWVIYQLMPVACLMGTLFTLSVLSGSNEMTAMFSIGMSLRRITAPIMITVAILSVTVFVAGDQVLPKLIQKRNYVEWVEIKKKPGLYSMIKTNKIWYRTENILFNIQSLNPQEATAQGITFYYFDPNWELTQLVTANHVIMKGRVWELKNGLVTLFAPESSFPLTKSFTEKSVTVNEDLTDIQSTSNSSEIMSLRELNRFIDNNKEAGINTLDYEVDFHAKFGFAFAALVMSFMGIPFAVRRSRSGGTMVNVGICLALAFAYWVAYSSALTLGRNGAIPPVVAAWGPNLLMLGFSNFLFMRLKR